MTVTVRVGAFVAGVQNSQEITHEKSLVGSGPLAATFVSTMERLGEKLGVLEDFLAGQPRGFRYAVEVRHHGWFGPRRDAARAGGLVPVDHARMTRMEEATVDELADVRLPPSTLAQLMEIRRRFSER